MTFREANELEKNSRGYDGELSSFGIETAKSICDFCDHKKECVPTIYFYHTIIKCNYWKEKENGQRNDS